MDRVIIRDIKGGIAEPFRLDSPLLPFYGSFSLLGLGVAVFALFGLTVPRAMERHSRGRC